MSVKIRYAGVTVGAKEKFVVIGAGTYLTSTPTSFSKRQYLNLSKSGLTTPNYQNAMYYYSMPLDGSAKAIPSIVSSNESLGYWSNDVSDENGDIDITITFTSNYGSISSNGISLTFDDGNDVYPTEMTITVYEQSESGDTIGETILSKTVYPTSSFYFFDNKLKDFTAIEIKIPKINKPNTHFVLRDIDYGKVTTFYGDELRSVNIIQEINPISAELAINTADFVIDSKTDYEFDFQKRQPCYIYFNDKLRSTAFVKSAKRTSKNMWSVSGEDYIGILDTTQFSGGLYDDKKATQLINEIMTLARVPYTISDDFTDSVVTGYIPYTTCREALMQVCFAIGAVADTSNSSTVDIYKLESDVSQTIPLNRILQGQSVSTDTRVSTVTVKSHAYATSSESLTAYDSSKSGTGKNILVTFSEPLHSLTITNGEILESGTNYARINADSNCVLAGKKYYHITAAYSMNNPNITESDVANEVSVDSATLVSGNNILDVLERVFNWAIKETTVSADIVEGKHENENEDGYTYDEPVDVGDFITVKTSYLGDMTGRVTKQTYNLNGGIIIKKSTILAD